MAPISTMPAYEAKSFARWVAYATERYFENPECRQRFEVWKAEREAKALQENGKADSQRT